MTFLIIFGLILGIVVFISINVKSGKQMDTEQENKNNSVSSDGNLIISIPIEANYDIPVISDDSGDVYKVNLYKGTCTCQDFIEYRSQFTRHSFKGFCKHLKSEIQKNMTPNPVIDLILNEKSIKENIIVFDENTVLGISPTYDWVDVYGISTDGDYKRFGFNKSTENWSFNEKPVNYREIRKHFKTLRNHLRNKET